MSSGSFRLARVHSGAPNSGRVYSRLLGFTQALNVAPGSIGFAQARLGDVWFIQVRLESLKLPSGYRGSFGFTHESLGVARFIRVRIASIKR